MATEHVTLHLDPVRSSEHMRTIVEAMSQSGREAFGSYAELLSAIRERYAFTDRTEPLSMARLLGILEDGASGIKLSVLGQSLYRLRPDVAADVLHFLLYSAWSARPDLGVSWAYRVFCDHLWAEGQIVLDAANRKQLVADVLSLAEAKFEGARPAFSTKSVLGLRKWLEPLTPPVLENDCFHRRDLCSRELVLLAVGHVARESSAQLNTDLLLTPERREAVARLCLLEPSVLDRRLDQALAAFPHLAEAGTRTGSYGRFIRLREYPTVELLLD